MIDIRIDKLEKKLEKALQIIKASTAEALQAMAEKMKQDIFSMAAMSYSPTWQAAKNWKGEPYFQAHKGLLEKINDSPIRLDSADGVMTVRFGHIPTLDQLTMSDGPDGRGFPYWRLFEYGTPSVRQGGSEKYGFQAKVEGNSDPRRKGGRRGEGYMKHISKNSSTLNPTRGVLPVHLFGDTLAHYKPRIFKRIRTEIRIALKRDL